MKRKSKIITLIIIVINLQTDIRSDELNTSHPLSKWAIAKRGFDISCFDLVTGADLLTGLTPDDKPSKSELAIFIGIQEKMRRGETLRLPEEEFIHEGLSMIEGFQPEIETKKRKIELVDVDDDDKKESKSDPETQRRRSKRNLETRYYGTINHTILNII